MHSLALIPRFLILVASILALTLFNTMVAYAAKPSAGSPSLLGNDISWPQCGKTLPKDQAFGIVGVNGGLANNTNPCLATQLAWANQSKGGTGQPLVSLYVNTANPGHEGSWWPSSNVYGGSSIYNPYGTCNGEVTPACAYIYGYAKATDNATIRGVSNPSSYIWWLDVETINTWQADKAANAADLEGMVAYYHSVGAEVGLYSTSYQWNLIVGTVAPESNLNNLRSWLAGARSESNAKDFCTKAPLTTGSPVTLTQFISRNLDYNYSCI